MEPIIELDSKIQVLYYDYKKFLSNKIKLVCSKVGFSYAGVKWIIFDPKISDVYGNKPNQIQQMWVGSKGRDYGACNRKDTIWISTLAINKEYSANSILNKTNQALGIVRKNEEDFLADVILDEIAHIATGCDHGSAKYDKKLAEFREHYYNDIVSRILNANI